MTSAFWEIFVPIALIAVPLAITIAVVRFGGSSAVSSAKTTISDTQYHVSADQIQDLPKPSMVWPYFCVSAGIVAAILGVILINARAVNGAAVAGISSSLIVWGVWEARYRLNTWRLERIATGIESLVEMAKRREG